MFTFASRAWNNFSRPGMDDNNYKQLKEATYDSRHSGITEIKVLYDLTVIVNSPPFSAEVKNTWSYTFTPNTPSWHDA
jgi:hypothetical protein